MAEEHDGDWIDRVNGGHDAEDRAPEHGAGAYETQGGTPDTTETRPA